MKYDNPILSHDYGRFFNACNASSYAVLRITRGETMNNTDEIQHALDTCASMNRELVYHLDRIMLYGDKYDGNRMIEVLEHLRDEVDLLRYQVERCTVQTP